MNAEGAIAMGTGIQFQLPWMTHPATLVLMRWVPSINENKGGRYN